MRKPEPSRRLVNAIVVMSACFAAAAEKPEQGSPSAEKPAEKKPAEVKPAEKKTVKMNRMPDTVTKNCTTSECHTAFSKKKYLHGPVNLGNCDSCHKPLDPQKHTWKFKRKGKDLCEYCHLEMSEQKNIHKPLKTGRCIDCHDPHSSNHKSLIVKDTIGGLCKTCHTMTHEEDKVVHGPVVVGQCTLCHDSHSSKRDYLLTGESPDLCYSCHVDTKKQLDALEFVHNPVEEDCLFCHAAHSSEKRKRVYEGVPQLCFFCHQNMENQCRNVTHKHSVVTASGGCIECHTPHGSNVKKLMKDAPMNICMNCHDKQIELHGDDVLPSFSKQVKGKKYLHGPVQDKNCTGCHKSHGSDHFRLLTESYPSRFYAPFSVDNYKLCFSCHSENIVLTKKTEDLTQFRNGTLNLHYLHVNKEKRGRTCRACHATHASNIPNHIRKSVPYGTWELPVGFTRTENGGTCVSGCHVKKTYDRKVPVDYNGSGRNGKKTPGTARK